MKRNYDNSVDHSYIPTECYVLTLNIEITSISVKNSRKKKNYKKLFMLL